CRLAVSLHAPDDERRETLVPVNTRWKVREPRGRGRAGPSGGGAVPGPVRRFSRRAGAPRRR
ncbi:hypothetical protein, partial [Streptomyces zhihengii]